MKKNAIKDTSIELALSSIDLYKEMTDQKEYVISKQILKCSTGVGANIHEALAAESKKDFIHKLSISLKEAREYEYWLRLIEPGDLVSVKTEEVKSQLNSVIALLTSIIKTSKKNSEMPMF